MRNPQENSIIIFSVFLMSLSKGYWQTFIGLLGKKQLENIDYQNSVFRLLHIITSSGPRSFQKFPTGIKIGRSLFLPLLFIFKKK